MIVLDTNVLSEPLRAQPNPVVLRWLSANSTSITTAISVGEVLSGAVRLREGSRKASLLDAIHRAIEGASEVLPYDESAARIFADLHETRRRSGRPLATEDGMIAAICLSRGAALATRNTKDFEGLGLDLVNPWKSAA